MCQLSQRAINRRVTLWLIINESGSQWTSNRLLFWNKFNETCKSSRWWYFQYQKLGRQRRGFVINYNIYINVLLVTRLTNYRSGFISSRAWLIVSQKMKTQRIRNRVALRLPLPLYVYIFSSCRYLLCRLTYIYGPLKVKKTTKSVGFARVTPTLQ